LLEVFVVELYFSTYWALPSLVLGPSASVVVAMAHDNKQFSIVPESTSECAIFRSNIFAFDLWPFFA
jgi:hypothetical protein